MDRRQMQTIKTRQRISLMVAVLKGFLIKFFSFLKNTLYVTKQEKRFIKHNQEVWKDYSHNKSEAEILFELTDMNTSIIAYSYSANILAGKHDARIRAYEFGENRPTKPPLRKIYESFNAEVFSYCLTRPQLLELDTLFYDVYSHLKTKKDVFNLSVSDVWFGDLLYDSHLMTHKVPTVDVEDHRFKNSLKKALYQYIYWRDYFDNHNVKAINVTHCSYLNGIPLRIAIQRGVPAYQFNVHGAYYMTKERLWAYTEFYDFPRQFLELPENERKNGLKVAKERIERRFAGEVGVDMPYSTKSAYTDKRVGKAISESNRVKVVIFTHCFFDSPNGLGVNLFPDFYEWLTFLGNISGKTDYDWYIKTHPDFLPGNTAIINEFIYKYPKFNLIPAETSHHQILEEGIDFALTVYGTIGFEYAALGKTVINASLSNPHIAYNFNIHAKTTKEYEEILLNLAEQKMDINADEVYEYYYMRFIKNDIENWLLGDYKAFLEEIGGYQMQFKPVAYEKFLADFSQERHNLTLQLLKNFVDSKDYCMEGKHYKHN